jgi:hypothetical protein
MALLPDEWRALGDERRTDVLLSAYEANALLTEAVGNRATVYDAAHALCDIVLQSDRVSYVSGKEISSILMMYAKGNQLSAAANRDKFALPDIPL